MTRLASASPGETSSNLPAMLVPGRLIPNGRIESEFLVSRPDQSQQGAAHGLRRRPLHRELRDGPNSPVVRSFQDHIQQLHPIVLACSAHAGVYMQSGSRPALGTDQDAGCTDAVLSVNRWKQQPAFSRDAYAFLLLEASAAKDLGDRERGAFESPAGAVGRGIAHRDQLPFEDHLAVGVESVVCDDRWHDPRERRRRRRCPQRADRPRCTRCEIRTTMQASCQRASLASFRWAQYPDGS